MQSKAQKLSLSASIKRSLEVGLGALGLEAYTMEVSLVSDAEIRAINRKHRGKDKATDVLSFPAFVGRRGKVKIPAWAGTIGSIVISRDTARAQAKEQRHSYRAEVLRLLVHGICHCVGYDHDLSTRDEKLMFAEEDRILAILKRRGVL